MISVDVMVPAIEKTYDFSLDENEMTVMICIEEIAEMICQREGLLSDVGIENMILIDKSSRRILEKSRTLSENNIKSGDTLILV